MSRTLGIGVCQIDTVGGEIQRNLDLFAEKIKSIMRISPWTQLVLTQELAFHGVIENWRNQSESIPGPITNFCADLAKKHKIYIAAGSLWEKEGDRFFNTTPVISPEGEVITTYRKMYPWRPYETASSGDQTVVFEIPEVGKIGLSICYDIWYPELYRDLAWKGAEVILHPSATRTQDRRQEHILIQAAAITNQCYIVDVNGVGSCGKGMSMLAGPEGEILQTMDQMPEFMSAMLNLDQVELVRKYGTAGVSRVLSSFVKENHHYDYQQNKNNALNVTEQFHMK